MLTGSATSVLKSRGLFITNKTSVAQEIEVLINGEKDNGSWGYKYITAVDLEARGVNEVVERTLSPCNRGIPAYSFGYFELEKGYLPSFGWGFITATWIIIWGAISRFVGWPFKWLTKSK